MPNKEEKFYFNSEEDLHTKIREIQSFNAQDNNQFIDHMPLYRYEGGDWVVDYDLMPHDYPGLA